jgi:hypothetical protein
MQLFAAYGISHAQSKTMKLKCWIGPLIAVIILLALRHTLYNEKKNGHQRSAIHAVIEEKKPELNPPMAGTRLHWVILPL